MATNTTLKSLNVAPAGEVQNYRQTEQFIANATIVLGDWVAYDFSKSDENITKYVVQADLAVVTAQMAIGVALNAAVAGEMVTVCTRGVCEGQTLAVAAAGDPLVITPTQGATDTQVAGGIHPVVGYAKSASASTGVHTVVVIGN
tara:strand:+ start:1809 stop:2243 length:435 start_codon:yes stop_codon:yes gene_type:complete